MSAVTILVTTAAFDGVAADTLDITGVSEEEQLQKAVQTFNDAQADEDSKVVCAKEPVSGTRFMKKVCRTVATMEANERNARSYLRNKKVIIANERNPNLKK